MGRKIKQQRIAQTHDKPLKEEGVNIRGQRQSSATVMGWRPSLGLVGGLHSARAESGGPKDGGNRLAGSSIDFCSSISASCRFIHQNVFCIGQADLLDGRFARLASKPAGEQTGQDSSDPINFL